MNDHELDHFLDHAFALAALEQACRELSEPHHGFERWIQMAVALMRSDLARSYGVFELIALAARAVTKEIIDSL